MLDLILNHYFYELDETAVINTGRRLDCYEEFNNCFLKITKHEIHPFNHERAFIMNENKEQRWIDVHLIKLIDANRIYQTLALYRYENEALDRLSIMLNIH